MTASLSASSPTTDHLSERDIAALRAVLTEELDAQRAQVLEHQATVAELTGQSDSDSILERELAEGSRRRALEAITEIEHALHRLDTGVYGICDRCLGPIALERLQAIPFTRHCVGCPPPGPSLLG